MRGAIYSVRVRAASVRARESASLTVRDHSRSIRHGRRKKQRPRRHAMTLDPAILRSSFEIVIDRRPDLTLRFYEILFEKYPHLQRMFSRDRGAQSKMLAGAVWCALSRTLRWPAGRFSRRAVIMPAS